MALRKSAKSQSETIVPETPTGSADSALLSDLRSRIEKISEQTGLDLVNLLQKWVLQEESLIGLMRYNKGQASAQTETRRDASDVQKQEKTAGTSAITPKYPKALFKKAEKLKKAGMTLKKIAEIFNDEGLPTISGVGKWHAGSIALLLNSKN
jgi:hypothetical protein